MTLLVKISIIFIISALICAAFIWRCVYRNRQSMKIMNVVWVLTALWASWGALWAYLKFGVNSCVKKKVPNINLKLKMYHDPMSDMHMDMPEPKAKPMQMDMGMNKPFWQKVTLSAFHCGAGCTLADIVGESLGFFMLSNLSHWNIFWQWGFDYVLALIFGVLFQFAAIQSMMKAPVGQTLLRALKIDFLSLTSWQVGMYVFMGFIFFVCPKEIYYANNVIFWFLMQIAMLVGFFFAYPTNYFLIKSGIKPSM